jgi:hypothetical protein
MVDCAYSTGMITGYACRLLAGKSVIFMKEGLEEIISPA